MKDFNAADGGFTNATSLIEDERMRQCSKGYGRDHDDTHTDGSLLRAAMDIAVGVAADETGEVPDPPKWVEELVEHVNKKYRRAPIRRLVVACALIGAEIERRERLQLAKKKVPS